MINRLIHKPAPIGFKVSYTGFHYVILYSCIPDYSNYLDDKIFM